MTDQLPPEFADANTQHRPVENYPPTGANTAWSADTQIAPYPGPSGHRWPTYMAIAAGGALAAIILVGGAALAGRAMQPAPVAAHVVQPAPVTVTIQAAPAPTPAPASGSARDDEYLADLRNHNITVDNPQAAIRYGHWVCDQRSQGRSADSLVKQQASVSPRLVLQGVVDWVAVAIEDYCPQYEGTE
jgi:hypothetical protein